MISRISCDRRYLLIALALLTLTAFTVRALSLDAQSLWRDEVDALRFATAPWSEMLGNFTRPGWNGPLYFLLLRGWIALTGASEYAMRFFSLIFGVLCVPLIYALGRRLFDPLTGLLAALLVALSPYLTWYSQEVKMYTLVPALALLALYVLQRAILEGGGKWWAVQIVATTLAFYSHILAALLILVQGLIYLAWWSLSRKRWKGALISLACLTLPYLPLVVWQAPLAFQERETGFHPYTLAQMAEILLNGWSTGIIGWGHLWGAGLMTALAVWGALSVGLRKLKRVGGLLAWLLIPLLSVWFISLRQPLFTDRYLIWSTPAFYLLVALGLASLRQIQVGSISEIASILMGLLLAGLILLSGANLWRQATVPFKADFRAAAAYVSDYDEAQESSKAHAQRVPSSADEEGSHRCYLPFVAAHLGAREENELLIFQIPYSRYTFNYYFPQEDYAWAEGLYTNHRAPDGSYLMGAEEAARHMEEMTEGYETVWLIASEVPMWDDRGLVRAWLESNLERVDTAHFARVDVFLYVRRKT